MPVTYSCDNCGRKIDSNLDGIRILGSKQVELLCEFCWEPVEKFIIEKREVVNVNK